jgi:hypothetical protein
MIDFATNTVITRDGIVKRRSNGCTSPPPLRVQGGNGYDARVLDCDPAWRRLVDGLSPGMTMDDIAGRIGQYAGKNVAKHKHRRALAALVILNDLPRLAALYRPPADDNARAC